MRTITSALVIAAFASLTLVSSEANAQVVAAEKWVQLGCQKVGFNVDRDVVRVGNRGLFRAIRLRAQGNNIYMLDLKVVYGNGAPDDIPVRAAIAAGATSGKLDLRGLDRTINRVEMIYRTQPNYRGRGTVCVDGLAVVAAVIAPPAVVVAPPVVVAPARAEWVRLGCKGVGFRVDRDVIRVAPFPGGFRAIRLRAARNDVFVINVRVIYGNGVPDDLAVGALIRAGTGSGALDLKGSRRQISQVELVYRSRPDFRGNAEVCVDGAV